MYFGQSSLAGLQIDELKRSLHALNQGIKPQCSYFLNKGHRDNNIPGLYNILFLLNPQQVKTVSRYICDCK